MDGLSFPGPTNFNKYIGGRISKVDAKTGAVSDLYTSCDGRTAALTGIHFAKADGPLIKEIVCPSHEPNGMGSSPDGSVQYGAETWTGRVMSRRITGPGEIQEVGLVDTWQCLYGFAGFQLLDSMAVDGAGHVCVATLVSGEVTVILPEGALVDFVPTGDLLTMNICFGGPDLRTAWITSSGFKRLLKVQWPRPGAKINYLNT